MTRTLARLLARAEPRRWLAPTWACLPLLAAGAFLSVLAFRRLAEGPSERGELLLVFALAAQLAGAVVLGSLLPWVRGPHPLLDADRLRLLPLGYLDRLRLELLDLLRRPELVVLSLLALPSVAALARLGSWPLGLLAGLGHLATTALVVVVIDQLGRGRFRSDRQQLAVATLVLLLAVLTFLPLALEPVTSSSGLVATWRGTDDRVVLIAPGPEQGVLETWADATPGAGATALAQHELSRGLVLPAWLLGLAIGAGLILRRRHGPRPAVTTPRRGHRWLGWARSSTGLLVVTELLTLLRSLEWRLALLLSLVIGALGSVLGAGQLLVLPALGLAVLPLATGAWSRMGPALTLVPGATPSPLTQLVAKELALLAALGAIALGPVLGALAWGGPSFALSLGLGVLAWTLGVLWWCRRSALESPVPRGDGLAGLAESGGPSTWLFAGLLVVLLLGLAWLTELVRPTLTLLVQLAAALTAAVAWLSDLETTADELPELLPAVRDRCG